MALPALSIPLFDADNHLYETREALTKYLPERYKGAIDYVEVRGRTKIVVRGRISEYIPNPTFEVVGRPGALADYFGGNNPDGRTPREIIGEPMRSVDAFLEMHLVRYKRPESYEISAEPLRDDAGKARRSALRAERITWLERGLPFKILPPSTERVN